MESEISSFLLIQVIQVHLALVLRKFSKTSEKCRLLRRKSFAAAFNECWTILAIKPALSPSRSSAI